MPIYYCQVEYRGWGTAYIHAEDLEEATAAFKNGEYMDVVGQEQDDYDFDLTSIEEGD